jgi:O-antigen/teichoic acid export membrane protein
MSAEPSTTGAFRRMAWQSALYTIANALSKAAGLILVYIQTDASLIPTSQFGLISQLTSVVLLVGPLLSFSLPLSLLHVLSTTRDADRDAAPFTTYTFVFVIAAVCATLGLLGAEALGKQLFGSAGSTVDPALYASLGRAVVLATVFEALGHLGFALAQIRERVVFFGVTQLSRFAVIIATHVLFIVVLGRGLEGAVWSLACAGATSALVMSTYLLRTSVWRFDWGILKRMLRYAAPLVLNGIALPFIYSGDRLVLGQMVGGLQLGLYDMAGRLAGVLNVILVQGFQTAFNAIGLKEHGATGGAVLHRRTFRHYAVFSGGFALGLSLFAGEVLPLVARSSEFDAAAPYVFPLSIGLMGYGLYIIAANVLLARNLNSQISAVVLSAGALNLVLNLALIPFVGILGAALATVASYALLAVGTGVLAQRAEGVRFPWRYLVRVLIVVCLLYAPSRAAVDWELLPRLATLCLLMALYPLGVLAAGVYRWSEVRRGAERLRMRAGGTG